MSVNKKRTELIQTRMTVGERGMLVQIADALQIENISDAVRHCVRVLHNKLFHVKGVGSSVSFASLVRNQEGEMVEETPALICELAGGVVDPVNNVCAVKVKKDPNKPYFTQYTWPLAGMKTSKLRDEINIVFAKAGVPSPLQPEYKGR